MGLRTGGYVFLGEMSSEIDRDDRMFCYQTSGVPFEDLTEVMVIMVWRAIK